MAILVSRWVERPELVGPETIVWRECYEERAAARVAATRIAVPEIGRVAAYTLAATALDAPRADGVRPAMYTVARALSIGGCGPGRGKDGAPRALRGARAFALPARVEAVSRHMRRRPMFEAGDYVAIVMMTSVLAGLLGAMFAAARGIARWARARGRRPWLWILVAYAVMNVAVGIAQAVLGGGR